LLQADSIFDALAPKARMRPGLRDPVQRRGEDNRGVGELEKARYDDEHGVTRFMMGRQPPI